MHLPALCAGDGSWAATLADMVAAGRKLETHTGGLTVTLRPTGRHGAAGVRRD